jgi:hypothetical protein
MMTGVNRSLVAVDTLARVDKRFEQLVGMLYGPDFDPEAVWEDAFGKAEPDQADIATHQSSLKRRLAFAGTVAGGVLGAKELGAELPKLGGAVGRRAGQAMGRAESTGRRLVPVKVRQAVASPRGRVGVAGTALGADVLAGNELSPSKKEPASKAVSVGAMAEGIQNKLKRLIPMAGQGAATPPSAAANAGTSLKPEEASALADKIRGGAQPPAPAAAAGPPGSAGAAGGRPSPVPPRPQAAPGPSPTGNATPGGQGNVPGASQSGSSTGAESYSNGRALGQLAGSATATPQRKLLLGGAAAAGAVTLNNRRKNGQQQASDPYAQYYGKRADFTVVSKFTEFDDDQQLAFGWASVTRLHGQPVLDRQGDYISTDDIEKAAYEYVQKSRRGGHMHRRDEFDQPVHVSDVVESVVFTPEKIEKMGLPADYPQGWWMGVKIHDPDVWTDVKSGKLTGFSIHGKGRRQEVGIDTAMEYS